MYNDGEPEGPEYIFGDTAPVPSDVLPTAPKAKRFRSFLKVKDNKEMGRICRKVARATNKKANPLPFATKGVLDTRSSEQREAEAEHNYTYTEIPDGNGPRRHPLFGINPDIVHDDEESPELEAESRLDIENVVSFDKEDLDRVTSASDKYAEEAQRLLLEEGAALLMSYDDASSAATAILRDGLGVTAEIDSSVSEVISHMMRLNLINAYAGKLSLPKYIKSRFMRNLTDKLSEDAHAAINKTLTSEKYRTALDNLRARIKPGSSEADPVQQAADMVGELGVVRRRSGTPGVPHPASDKSSDQHDFNERQAKGVRKGAL